MRQPTDVPSIDANAAGDHRVARLSALSLLGLGGERALALVLVALIAAAFGATGTTDTYFLALIVPLTIGLSLSEALYTSLLSVFANTPWRSAIRSALRLSLTVAASATGLYVIGLLLIHPQRVGAWVAFAPVIVTSAISGVYAALLVTERQYAAAVLRVPLASLVSLALCAALLPTWKSITVVAIAVSVGNVVAVIVLMLRAPTVDRHQLRQRIPARPLLMSAGAIFSATLIGGQLVVLVERLLAAGLPPGSVAKLGFARGLALVPVLLAQALSNGMLPAAAERFASYRTAELRRLTTLSLRLGISSALAATVVIVLARQALVRVALERGKLDANAAAATSRLTALLALAVVGVSAAAIASRGLFAMGRQRLVALLSLAGVLLYSVAAVIGRVIGELDGLATAYSVATLVSGAAVVIVFGRALEISPRDMIHHWLVVPVLLATTVLLGAALGWIPTHRLPGLLGAIATLLATFAGGAIVLGCAVWIVNPTERGLLVELWRRRVAR